MPWSGSATASDRQALAALGASPLERELAGPRLHPRTEAVRPRALTLLRLIRTLHDRVAEYSDRPFFPPNAPCRGGRPSLLGIFRAPGAAQCNPLQTQNQTLTRRISRVVTPELEHVWQQIQGALLETVGEQTYGLWLAPLRCVSLNGDTLVLEGPPEVSAWASSRLAGALASAAASVLGPAVAVSIADAGGAHAPATPPARVAGGESGLNPKYAFEQFVIGPPTASRTPRPCRSPRCLAGLQPALHLRPARARQDAPPAFRRQLRPRVSRRPDRALRDGRGVHQRLPPRPRHNAARRVQGAVSRRRHAPDRRRPVPRSERPAARRSSFTPSTRSMTPAISS